MQKSNYLKFCIHECFSSFFIVLSSMYIISQRCPSISSKLRPYIHSWSWGYLDSLPPAPVALPIILSTFSLLSTDNATHFSIFWRIANFLFSKCLKKFFNQEHDKYIFTNNHTCCVLISKLRVELKTKFGKELYRFIEILYW